MVYFVYHRLTTEGAERYVPAMAEATTQVAFRFPDELLARLDRYVTERVAEQPGIRFTRADAVRSFVEMGLQGAGHAARSAKRPKR